MSQAYPEPHKLTDDEFDHIVRRLLEDAEEFVEDEISWRREKSWRYFNGEVDLKQPKGRSGFVMTEVRDCVDAVMPMLMDIFTGSDRLGEYIAETPEAAVLADQATALANHIFLKKNPGWRILHDAFKDGLMSATAIVKLWVDTKERREPMEFEGDADGLNQALSGPDMELDEALLDEDTGMVSAKLNQVQRAKAVIIEGVPPEELLIDRRAQRVDEAAIVGQRRVVRAHTLTERFTTEEQRDIIYAAAHPSLDQAETETEKLSRQNYDHTNPDSASHWATKEVEFYELYCRIDRNGDHEAEVWRVYGVGDSFQMLDSEEVEGIPYCIGTPLPKPHTVIGTSLAEYVWDIQDVNSHIVRNMLDNLTLVNNPRHVAVEGQVNMKELQDNRYNGVVRARNPQAVVPLTTPSVSHHALPVLEFMEQRKEQRTGTSKAALGLDPDALQSSTEIGVRSTVTQAQKKVQLYARSYAETLVAPLYKKILELIASNFEGEVAYKTQNGFEVTDPSNFDPTMQVYVNVGLGMGDRDERMGALMQILNEQKFLLDGMGPNGPLVNTGQLAQTYEDLVMASPLSNPRKYFSSPQEAEQKAQQQAQQEAQQGPPPDPEKEAKAQAIQQKMQLDAQEAQQKAQLDQQKAAQDAKISQEKAQSDVALKQAQMEGQMAIDRWKAEQEIALRRAELALEAELEKMKVAMNPEGPGVGNIPRNGGNA